MMFAITWKETQKNALAIGSFIVLSIGLVLVFNNVLPGIFGEEKAMLDTNYGLLMGIWINMLVFSGLMSGEKEEDQNRGYEFYKTIPVSDRQIVLGKFLTVLLNTVFGVAVFMVLMGIFPYDMETLLRPQAYVLVSAGVSLVLVGLLYPLCFRWGYTRVMSVVILVYIGAMMLPQMLHLLLLIMDQEDLVDDIFRALTVPASLVFLAVSLVIYVLLAWRAVRLKQKLTLAG
jgi:hypothetical protein